MVQPRGQTRRRVRRQSSAIAIRTGPAAMEDAARRFTLKGMLSKHGTIIDAYGSTGFWPFREPISYHVGINCDAISADNGELRVQRYGQTVALARLPRK